MVTVVTFSSSSFLFREKADRKHDHRYQKQDERCSAQPGASVPIPPTAARIAVSISMMPVSIRLIAFIQSSSLFSVICQYERMIFLHAAQREALHAAGDQGS